MSIDVINELENKVDNLIISLQKARDENSEKDSMIHELKQKNEDFTKELESCKKSSMDTQVQFDTATEKIKNLLIKLEKVE